VRLSDSSRLAILNALQQYPQFSAMSGGCQRQWRHALLAPLSAAGVRARCISLISASSGAPKQDGRAEHLVVAAARNVATQLEQLALHDSASDDVVVAVMCRLFSAAYFAPADDAASASCSVQGFCASAGLAPLEEAGEVTVHAPSDARAKECEVWRAKFWSAMGALIRRPLPDMAQKVIESGNFSGAESDSEDPARAALRTTAFHGCLADGSLLVMRMQEWWDYATGAGAGGVSEPGKKKRKKAGALRCTVDLGDELASLRRECMDLCASIMHRGDIEGGLKPRQRNALCSLPSCLAFSLLGVQADDERTAAKEALEDALEVLRKMAALGTKTHKPSKMKALTSEAMANLPRIAAELYVTGTGMVKEAARAAWRELGEFITDETLTSLSASIRDADGDEGKDGEGEDEEGSDSDGEADGPEAVAKAAAFAKATEALKAQREAEPEDEDEDITMDQDNLLEHLLGDEDAEDKAQASGALASFASTGLDTPGAFGQKLTKRQKRLRQRQEDVMRKLRELELVELFLVKCGDSRKISLELLKGMHELLLASARRAAKRRSAENAEGGAGKGKQGRPKSSRGDIALRQLEAALAQRVAKLLAKALRQASRLSALASIAQWDTAEGWAKQARECFEMCRNYKAPGVGQKPLEVSALLLYVFCAAHRASLCSKEQLTKDNLEQWSLATELLTQALEDWSTKKDLDRSSTAMMEVFVIRIPRVVLALPWVEQLRASAARKAYVHREQMAFITGRLLHGLPPDVMSTSAGPLAAGFAMQCAEALESTLQTAAASPALSNQQRTKLRRESLRGLRTAFKLKIQETDDKPWLSHKDGEKISSIIAKVRDSLQARHGEVYLLCLHLLRSPRLAQFGKGWQQRADKRAEKRPGKRPQQSESNASPAPKRRKERDQDSAASASEGRAAKGSQQAQKGGSKVAKETA